MLLLRARESAHDRNPQDLRDPRLGCRRISRLTGADEDRTLARLRALRSDLIDPTIAVHNGRVVKRTGDGALVEFRSVVDAVRCAIEVQNAMVERNAGVPQERRIEFRIGIHLGDVVEESDGDLMGDGVNIAARLEGIAQPGAICLSEDAYRQVKARLDLEVNDLGETQLKNIAEPVGFIRCRSVSTQRGPRREPNPPRLEKPSAQPVSDKPSIAVLAFNNMSGDAEQEYFSDGISEDIITDLSMLVRLARDRSQLVLRLQDKPAVSVPDVANATRRPLCARGQRAKGGQPSPGDGAIDRFENRRTCLGQSVRPRPHRHFRRSGRTHAGDRGRAQAEADNRRTGSADFASGRANVEAYESYCAVASR